MQRPLNKGISSTVGIAVRTGLLVALFFGPRCVSTNGARTMDREFLIPGSEPLRVIVREGDITLEDSDAIVNAANTHMMGGSGVDGAVHSRAGPELLKACIALPIVGPPRTRVRTGDAVLLPGFRLKSKYVIAAVGPVFSTEEVSVPLFRNAINRALQLGKEEDKIASISFPALSCGVYGFPPRLAAETFFTLIRDKTGDASASTRLGLTEVRVVLFGGRMFRIWEEAASRILIDTASVGSTGSSGPHKSGQCEVPETKHDRPAPDVDLRQVAEHEAEKGRSSGAKEDL